MASEFSKMHVACMGARSFRGWNNFRKNEIATTGKGEELTDIDSYPVPAHFHNMIVMNSAYVTDIGTPFDVYVSQN